MRTMKKLRYRREKSLLVYLPMTALFMGVGIFSALGERHDRADLLISAAVVIVGLCSCAESLILLYKKRKCKTHGTAYKGRITGKTGHSTARSGYFYTLKVRYKNGSVTTPLIDSRYVDRLKSRNCTVYEYGGMVYIDDYQLCVGDEKAADINLLR